jgi:DNA-binding protein HU-beta
MFTLYKMEVIKMTKAELVEFIAEKADLTKADAGRALEAMIEGITEGLKKEGKVTFVGFGTFTAKKRAAREGRNPQTGETVKIAARVVPGFKAGSKLKDALN